MNSRRSFIRKMGKVSLSAYAFSSPLLNAAQITSNHSKIKHKDDKLIRIGIIGAENSHTRGFGRMFNIEKKFPGVEVLYVWGETDEFARDAMDKGGIPNMVKDPKEMLGKIDALIVDHRHAKYHLEAATPFVKAGIPTFIDKPFCYRVSEGKEFLQMARDLGTPVTSFSSVAQSDATFDIKKQVESMEKINQVVRYGPVDIESKYGGIFFYGVHIVQPLMYIFGEDIEKVRITRNGKNASASLAYRNGMLATLVFSSLHYGWETFIETEDRIVELKSRVEETDPARNYKDMVEMFRTGKEPRSHQSILSCVAVLEALEKSVLSEKWEEVKL
ncbi:MAG: Gfo/Idh/MocA family oxidoreductase [Bacteroidetes bacterium]|nr:Gfo/Idh/MocA family oxidoreductase [Bacteroidota bacterium]